MKINKKKFIKILLLSCILLGLIILNRYMSANVSAGFFEVKEKYIDDGDYTMVIVGSVFGTPEITLKLDDQDTFVFQDKLNEPSYQVTIHEIWAVIQPNQTYYMRFREFHFPWRLYKKNELQLLQNY